MEEKINATSECRKKKRSEDELRSLTNRLKRIEGPVRGVRGMLENDEYCASVLMQVSAISSALTAFVRELLSSHIHTCVVEDIKNEREGAADELVELLRAFVK